MVAAAPVQFEITRTMAAGFYANAMEAIRRRHDPAADKVNPTPRAESWEVATAHVVMGLSEFEATAIFRLLIGQRVMAHTDVILAEALAARLGFKISWQRKGLVE